MYKHLFASLVSVMFMLLNYYEYVVVQSNWFFLLGIVNGASLYFFFLYLAISDYLIKLKEKQTEQSYQLADSIAYKQWLELFDKEFEKQHEIDYQYLNSIDNFN